MKRLKGMTLLEVVIAIGIFALLSLLIVQTVSSVNTVMRITTDLNERIYQEKVYVNTHQTSYLLDAENDAGNVLEYDPNGVTNTLDLSVQYNISDPDTNRATGIFLNPGVNVIEKVTTNDGSAEAVARDNRLDSNIHFRFLEFGGIARNSASATLSTGRFSMTATNSGYEIQKVTITADTGFFVYLPGTTTEVNSYTLDATQLEGGDGQFSAGDTIFVVNAPDRTTAFNYEIEFVMSGSSDVLTVEGRMSSPFRVHTDDGSYQIVSRSSIYYFTANGSTSKTGWLGYE